jgi:hypothetical protein
MGSHGLFWGFGLQQIDFEDYSLSCLEQNPLAGEVLQALAEGSLYML